MLVSSPTFSTLTPFCQDEEQTQLLKDTDVLHKTTAQLHRAQQVSAHTDRLAVDVMEDLHGQRAQLVHTRYRVSGSVFIILLQFMSIHMCICNLFS